MDEKDYGTPVTLGELREQYRTHFLSSGQFIDLVRAYAQERCKEQREACAERFNNWDEGYDGANMKPQILTTPLVI